MQPKRPGLMPAQPWVRAALILAFLALMLALCANVATAQQVPRVRAVLFYSPTCPHCHRVLSVDLPPLVEQYGDRLQVLAVSTALPAGRELYLATVRRFAIPDGRLGVPTLVVGTTVLVGADEIPGQLPGIIERALAEEGLDWPDLPELRALLADQGLLDAPVPTAAPTRPDKDAASADAPEGVGDGEAEMVANAAPAPAIEAPAPAAVRTDSPAIAPAGGESGIARTAAPVGSLDLDAAASALPSSMSGRFRLDPVANGIAVAVLVAMMLALGMVGVALARARSWRAPPEWLTPLLAMVGLGVAAYLAYVEVTGVSAVCGPVGDCNTVQQSPYARIGGILPVGVVGMIGYLLLLITWSAAATGPLRQRPVARRLFWRATLAGTVFSIYLTFLEPFLIGATCAWCITSALVMTALLLAATPHVIARAAVSDA